jgi:sulfur-carrier protein
MQLHLQYFALLREQRGLRAETVETTAATPGRLYEELKAKYAFTLPGDRVRAAVNGEFVPAEAPLKTGDTVVFIPPVAGG